MLLVEAPASSGDAEIEWLAPTRELIRNVAGFDDEVRQQDY